MNRLLQDLVTRQAESRPDAVAVVFGSEKLSYGQLEKYFPDHLSILYNHALALSELKQYKPAIERLQFIARQEPKNYAALINLYWNFVKNSQEDKAKHPLRDARVDPSRGRSGAAKLHGLRRGPCAAAPAHGSGRGSAAGPQLLSISHGEPESVSESVTLGRF